MARTTHRPESDPLDVREWEYVSPLHEDPRFRARLRVGRLVDESVVPHVEVIEEWQYGGTGDPTQWPTQHKGMFGDVTNITRDGAGAILETNQANISVASEKDPDFSIKNRLTYDSSGRVIEEFWPNRLDQHANPRANVKYEYYLAGPQEGYLRRASVRDQNENEKRTIESTSTTCSGRLLSQFTRRALERHLRRASMMPLVGS